MRVRPTLLLLAVLAAAALGGCTGVEGLEALDFFMQVVNEEIFRDLEVDGVRVAAGSTTNWSVPSEITEPGTYVGGQIDIYFVNTSAPPHESLVGMGLGYYGDGDGGELFTGAIFWDVGHAIARCGGRNPRTWVVVRPEVGFWAWTEAAVDNSGRSGPLTGVSLGLARMTPKGARGGGGATPHLGILGLEYKLQRINNAVGNDDATVGKVELSCSWRW